MPSRNNCVLSSSIASLVAVALVFPIWTMFGCSRASTASSDSTDAKTSDKANAIAAAPTKERDLRKPVVQIETSLGSITVRLDAIQAPGTVSNFLDYVNSHFYDNTLVHYVKPGDTILAGGYSADRKPKPPTRAAIRNEAHNGLKNVRGTIAMARDELHTDSATSQFFINLADAPQRNHTGDTADTYGNCVFGEVTDGLDIAEKISQSTTANLPCDLAKTPDPPVVIKSIRVVQ